jgi:hypothetical protein
MIEHPNGQSLAFVGRAARSNRVRLFGGDAPNRRCPGAVLRESSRVAAVVAFRFVSPGP